MENQVGDFEVQSVREAATAGHRLDGRAFTQLHPIQVSTDTISQASGSAQLRMGSVDVVVGVKAEVGVPDAAHPNEGQVQISVTLSPTASTLDPRKLEDESTLYAARLRDLVLSRQHQGAGIDLSNLCIIPGRSCWVLYVDCVILSTGGSLLDALSLAVHAALRSTAIPRVSVDEGIEDATAEDIEVDPDPHAYRRVDVSNMPIIISTSQIERRVVVGSTALEEAAATSRMHVAVDQRGRVCGLVKVGSKMLDFSTMQHMVATAQRKGGEVFSALSKRFSAKEQ